jgi:hypothetical protein
MATIDSQALLQARAISSLAPNSLLDQPDAETLIKRYNERNPSFGERVRLYLKPVECSECFLFLILSTR